jgi:DNA polymerase-4
MSLYVEVAREIRKLMRDLTPLVEPLSLDEAYLDVSEDRRGLGSARATAEEIRARIRADTGLTASAGVSYNKFIAKLASDQNKPDGLCVIPPAKAPGSSPRCPSAASTASGRSRRRRWSGWASAPAQICARAI